MRTRGELRVYIVLTPSRVPQRLFRFVMLTVGPLSTMRTRVGPTFLFDPISGKYSHEFRVDPAVPGHPVPAITRDHVTEQKDKVRPPLSLSSPQYADKKK